MVDTVNPRIHLNEIEEISNTPITSSSILSRRRDTIISAPIPIKLLKNSTNCTINIADYLQNSNTLLPTVPDLTLNQPKTPDTSSYPKFPIEPAPSLILNFDTTPLSMSISKKENQPPPQNEEIKHSMDSIRLGGNQPSGVNDQKTNSVSSDQVLNCCEDQSQSKWNPWSMFTTRSASPSPKLSSKPLASKPLSSKHTNRSRLSLLPISPNKLHSKLNKIESIDKSENDPNASHQSIRTKHSKSFILGNGPLLSLPKSLSNKHTSIPTPPPLSPPSQPPQSNYNTLREIRKKSRRVSEWLSPMKYDRDAEEIGQVTDHSLKLKNNLKSPESIDEPSGKTSSKRFWTSRPMTHSQSEPIIESGEISPDSSKTSSEQIETDITKTSDQITSSFMTDKPTTTTSTTTVLDEKVPDLKITNEGRNSLRNSKLLNRFKSDIKIKSIW
ncbi:hypothetical protein DFH28DRAFT_892836 [Melampsora americana]|nr:hypothetical protein DFH28DRAFT_892836 [Melampsora americana]